jgi:hypothetical protein
MKLCIHVRPRDDGQGWAVDVFDGRRAWTKTHLGESPLNKAEAHRLAHKLRDPKIYTARTKRAVNSLLPKIRLSRASCPMTDHTSEDDESDIIIAGRQVPFVQVGMIVHPDDCLNCERDGNPLWCSALVCDIHDDDETARFGMMATLLFRNGERREEPCAELRRRWRMARDFDQNRVYTGRWGATPRGSVWPVAEVNEDA